MAKLIRPVVAGVLGGAEDTDTFRGTRTPSPEQAPAAPVVLEARSLGLPSESVRVVMDHVSPVLLQRKVSGPRLLVDDRERRAEVVQNPTMLNEHLLVVCDKHGGLKIVDQREQGRVLDLLVAEMKRRRRFNEPARLQFDRDPPRTCRVDDETAIRPR